MVGRSDRTDRTEERIIPGADRKWKYRRSSEKEICEELGVNSMKVIAVASHDTQSASAAVPTQEKDFIFISCGTWSLYGTELDEPVIGEKSLEMNVSNEGGYGGKINFLKNLTGLWMVQESRRQWIREGNEYSFGELETQAKEVELFQNFVDANAEEFVSSGNMPRRIREYCKQTGQTVPRRRARSYAASIRVLQ